MTTHILEFHMLEVLPNALDRIEVGSVTRQADELYVGGSSLRQVGFDLTIMDRRTIPDDQQLAANLATQMLEKSHHIGTAERPILPADVQLAGWRDRANQRTMIAAQSLAKHWRLAERGIGAHAGWQQIAASFIQENQGALVA